MMKRRKMLLVLHLEIFLKGSKLQIPRMQMGAYWRSANPSREIDRSAGCTSSLPKRRKDLKTRIDDRGREGEKEEMKSNFGHAIAGATMLINC
ncbi:hypothetical protein Cni_G01914 [Canna indica]|uniref:Uncharacterized protein n=1 Tax=Canna indica TaxID=4628 RepID=A0AAQ3Q1P9_9LILI|nr:hypothetical protein Cni_G01914 [Canna indica]